MFAMNPEYVPGGVQNFWTRSPPAEGDGSALAKATEATAAGGTATGAAGGTMTRGGGGFLAGFFTNAEYVGEPAANQPKATNTTTVKEEAMAKLGACWTMPKMKLAMLDFYALPPLNGSY